MSSLWACKNTDQKEHRANVHFCAQHTDEARAARVRVCVSQSFVYFSAFWTLPSRNRPESDQWTIVVGRLSLQDMKPHDHASFL